MMCSTALARAGGFGGAGAGAGAWPWTLGACNSAAVRAPIVKMSVTMARLQSLYGPGIVAPCPARSVRLDRRRRSAYRDRMRLTTITVPGIAILCGATAIPARACPGAPGAGRDTAQLTGVDHYVRVRSTAPSMNGQTALLYVRERIEGRALLDGRRASCCSSTAPERPPKWRSTFRTATTAGCRTSRTQADSTCSRWTSRATADSTRPTVMNDPCNLARDRQRAFAPGLLAAPCAPSYATAATTIASDWNDIGAVVDYVRALRKVDRVSLVAWSLGGPRAGGYAAQNPDRVQRLVLLAPGYARAAADAPPASLPARAAFNTQSGACTRPEAPRVALVHDFLLDLRGAERVFLAICDIWPDADIYTAVYDERGTEGRFAHRDVAHVVPPAAAPDRAHVPAAAAALSRTRSSRSTCRGYDLVLVELERVGARGASATSAPSTSPTATTRSATPGTTASATLARAATRVSRARCACCSAAGASGTGSPPSASTATSTNSRTTRRASALLRARVDGRAPAGRDGALRARRRSATTTWCSPS